MKGGKHMLTNFERRKFIIDTDTASDDCAAIMMAVLSEKAEILGLTTVAGNIPLDKATNNALQTLEVCGADIPVFEGASHPLIRPLKTAVSVHGEDGLGDRGLVNPKGKAQTKPAVDFILDSVKKYPEDIEIIAIGPVTNIANAILTDPETMKKVKKIWSMGTAGFGFGNATPVAEFNVYVDAEAYKIMLDFGLPLTIIGFDICLGDSAFDRDDLEKLKNGNTCGKFIYECTKALHKFNLDCGNGDFVDLADAAAMGVVLYDDIVTEAVSCCCFCCTKEEEAYGQVIPYVIGKTYSVELPHFEQNCVMIKSIDSKLYKKHFFELFI